MEFQEPIWERQPGESSLWYHRFHSFLLMGPKRSLLGAYNIERERDGKVRKQRVPRSWCRACTRWEWRTRAEAFDENLRKEQEAEWRARQMPSGQVLATLSDQARADVSDFFSLDENGQPVLDLVKAQKAGKLHLIKAFKYDRQGRVVVEFHDAQKALETLGRYYKLWTDGVEHSGTVNVVTEKRNYKELEENCTAEELVRLFEETVKQRG